MRAADRYARLTPEQKRRVDEYKAELLQQNRERQTAFWANMTPEQREAYCAKLRVKKNSRVGRGKAKGATHYRAVLTEEKVRAIHADMRAAWDVAEAHGVTVDHVRKIWNGKVWAHLGLPKLQRKDHRVREKIKVEPPPPLLTPEHKEVIMQNPYMDTRVLAEKIDVHWMVVATYRQKLLRKGKR